MPEIERQQKPGQEVVFRAGVTFVNPEIHDTLEAPNAENPAGDCIEKWLWVCCQSTLKPKLIFRLTGTFDFAGIGTSHVAATSPAS
jgi:hypothetical protein